MVSCRHAWPFPPSSFSPLSLSALSTPFSPPPLGPPTISMADFAFYLMFLNTSASKHLLGQIPTTLNNRRLRLLIFTPNPLWGVPQGGPFSDQISQNLHNKVKGTNQPPNFPRFPRSLPPFSIIIIRSQMQISAGRSRCPICSTDADSTVVLCSINLLFGF